MIYAQIRNSTVVNTIVLNDASLICLFSTDSNGVPYDSLIQIDTLFPQPAIGWIYDGINFFYPSVIAVVQNNVVVNVISRCNVNNIVNNGAYQAIVNITNFNPQPAVGWIYNLDGSLSAPPTPGSQAYYQSIVASAITFGQSIIVGAAARNISMGITQAGMTAAVMAYTDDLLTSLLTGSLYQAIAEIMVMIADTSAAKVGAYATGPDGSLLSGTITFTAVTLGTIGNSITLTFNGLQQVGTVVSAWNAANPGNQVTYTGSSTAVPESATVTLSGGAPTLAPFITNDTLYATLNQIQTYLEIPLTPNPGP